MTVWILTKANENIDGCEYIERVFAKRPSEKELVDEGVPEESSSHVMLGGGRRFLLGKGEEIWYYLRSYECKE